MLCRLPVTKFNSRRRKRQTVSTTEASFFGGDKFADFDDNFNEIEEAEDKKEAKSFDPSVSLDSDTYCEILASLDEECWESNIVELWNYDKEQIKALNEDEIVNAVNSKQIR